MHQEQPVIRGLIEVFKEGRGTKELSEAALRALAEVSLRKTIRSGQCLWRMGDPADFVGIILRGGFEVSRLSSVGNEYSLAVFGPADAIGMSAVLQKKAYPGTARAFSRSAEVVKIYLRPLIQRTGDPLAIELSDWLRELLIVHEQILRDKIDIVSAGRVGEKVFELLLQLNRRFGVRTSRTASRIPLKLSKTQVSRMVDARVETVIRLLGLWNKKNLVSFGSLGIDVSDWAELEKEVERGKSDRPYTKGAPPTACTKKWALHPPILLEDSLQE